MVAMTLPQYCAGERPFCVCQLLHFCQLLSNLSIDLKLEYIFRKSMKDRFKQCIAICRAWLDQHLITIRSQEVLGNHVWSKTWVIAITLRQLATAQSRPTTTYNATLTTDGCQSLMTLSRYTEVTSCVCTAPFSCSHSLVTVECSSVPPSD